MTTTPPEPEKTSRTRHAARTLARLDRALANSQPLRTQRLRGPDESLVVIASAPPRNHLVISVRAAQGPHPSTQGLAGLTVAVRAVPILQQPDVDEDSATCVFDREHVLPAASTPIGTPAGVVDDSGGRTLPLDLPAPPSLRRIGGAEPAWAQDTLRCVAQTVARQERTPTAGWFGLSAACLLASAVALYSGVPTAEDAASRLIVRGGEGSVEPARIAPAAQPVSTPAQDELATRRPVASVPHRAERATPSARLELHELTLDVTATPWMEVLVDGRSLGHTPRLKVPLAPGTHEITLVNRDLDLRTSTVVSAERGSSEMQDIAFE